MNLAARARPGAFHLLIGDGRALLRFSAAMLVLAGGFVLILGATGRLLPHDESYLGMSAADLCALHGCRIVHFMIHDRISFGGALLAVGLIYGWLTEEPLKDSQAWAWWALALSSALGFCSFFAYLGYGYLDTWHGLATLALLPCFLLGLGQSFRAIWPGMDWRGFIHPPCWTWRSAEGMGRVLLLSCAAGMFFGGLTILAVGTTCVFVPQDLDFMALDSAALRALNPRLIPLIAHDRAGFGGAVACVGLALFACVWHAAWSRGLWLTLAAVGVAGFGAGIAAHPAVGYIDPLHLAPAVLGAWAYQIGLVLTWRAAMSGGNHESR